MQELKPEDCNRRIKFSETRLGWHEDWAALFGNILWSDEVVYCSGGFINRHKYHYWASNEIVPKTTVKRMQARLKVDVWHGMTATKIIGSCLMPGIIRGARFSDA